MGVTRRPGSAEGRRTGQQPRRGCQGWAQDNTADPSWGSVHSPADQNRPVDGPTAAVPVAAGCAAVDVMAGSSR